MELSLYFDVIMCFFHFIKMYYHKIKRALSPKFVENHFFSILWVRGQTIWQFQNIVILKDCLTFYFVDQSREFCTLVVYFGFCLVGLFVFVFVFLSKPPRIEYERSKKSDCGLNNWKHGSDLQQQNKLKVLLWF